MLAAFSNRSHNRGSCLQAFEQDLAPTRRTYAHEDTRLLWDLESCFRAAVRDSVRPAEAPDTHSCSVPPVGAPSSPCSPMATFIQRSSVSIHQQRTAGSKFTLKPGFLTGLSCTPSHHIDQHPSQHGRVSLGIGMVRARKTAGSPGEDLTRQLRMMFCREVKRKKRKTSVLPKVAEVPRESSLQLEPSRTCSDGLTSHEQDLSPCSLSM